MYDVLYHYCPLDAFVGIIQSKQIWLTNIFCMNDAAEHYWLRRVAQDILQRKPHADETLSKSFASKLFPKEEDTDLYCCCFSRADDSLSQWRAYADDGRGVAIGFFMPFLRDLYEKHRGLRLESVVYDLHEQERLVGEIIGGLEDEGQAPPSSLPEELVRDLPAVVAKVQLWFSAARCKNPFFHEEQEFRLIYDPSVDLTSPKMGQRQFRPRGDMLVPYYALPLPADTHVFCRIVFGPKSAYKHNEKVARALLSEGGFKLEGIDFCHSEGTYR